MQFGLAVLNIKEEMRWGSGKQKDLPCFNSRRIAGEAFQHSPSK